MPANPLQFVDSFRGIVARHGDAPAILEAGRPPMSYSELSRRASAVAAQLIQLGIGRESIVGLCARKSEDYIVSILGVWYAGAAFVPLDPDLPRDRLAFMVCEASVQVVFTPADLVCVYEPLGVHVVGLNTCSGLVPNCVLSTNEPDDLAYIIFTSGSTGRPKGVMITHRGICNLLRAQIDAFELTPANRSLFFLSTCFDASISDIGTILLSGAAMYIEPPADMQPGPTLAATMRARRITHIDLPPALLQTMDPADMPATLKTIIIGGEVCPAAVVRKWAARFRVVNVYGPTEATVCTSLGVCRADLGDDPEIGMPIPGVVYSVRDDGLNPVLPGVPGELCISGISLARGYVHQPELTARRFIVRDGVRLYRTGDRVVQRNGQWVFLGRIDRQIKLHGRLVAPEEIEAALATYPMVSRVAVVHRKLPTHPPREGLVAFVVATDESARPARSDLLEHLARRLPRWMRPHRIEFAVSLPETITGKADLHALQWVALAGESRSVRCEDGPISTHANLLIEIWERVLGVESIGLDDDFTELGGDSMAILDVVLAAAVRGMTIPPLLLGERMTIRRTIAGLGEESALPPGAKTCVELRRDVMAEHPDLFDITHAGDPVVSENMAACRIFLTGASGFLGSRLLAELLRRTTAYICCLVRAENIQQGERRIAMALAGHGIALSDDDLNRISVFCGNLALPRLGLSEGEWNRLTESVDTVHHCAAWVNSVHPYEVLRPGNVQGTAEILRFVRKGRPKRLNYASTLSVFVGTDRNTGNLCESDALEQTKIVYGGYAQSKWAAEWMLRNAVGTGPVSIFRFGLITGDSQTGYSAPDSYLALFIRSLEEMGCVPAEAEHLAMDLTPVDYAAAATARLSICPHVGSRTWHIANRQSLTLGALCEAMCAFGLKIERVSRSRWEERVAARPREGSVPWAACLGLCRAMFDGADGFARYRTMDLFQATGVQFAMENTLADLAGTGISCPPPDRTLLVTYLRHLFPKMDAGVRKD